MDSRLQDILTLVSRVHEKRGDIRFMLRQDPAVQHEVHTYLDDLNWLGRLYPVQPNRIHEAAGKEQLLAMMSRQGKGRRRTPQIRVLGAAASVSLLFVVGVTMQAASHNLAEPVGQVLNGVFFLNENQAHASPSPGTDLSTPSELALETNRLGDTN